MDLQAFLSRRVVTPEGIRPAGVLVEGETIRDVVTLDQVPPQAKITDYGEQLFCPALSTHTFISMIRAARNGKDSRLRRALQLRADLRAWWTCR